MAGFDPLSALASVGGAAIGGIGDNAASQAQRAAANQQARMQRQNLLMGLQLNEPARAIGYGADADLARQFGYDLPAYQSNNSLMATMNPLTTKQVKGMVKNGMSVDQIGQVGTYAGQLDAKSIKRLTRLGLSPDQIQQLSTRQSSSTGGVNQANTPSAGQSFVDSPDYQWRINEGQRNIGNTFAARGGAASGNALRALSQFNQGIAGQELDNWFNRRMRMAGRGDQANQNIQSGSNTYTNGYNNAQQAAGDARASGVLGVAGAIQGGLSGVMGSFGGMGGMPRNTLPTGYPTGTRYDTPGIYNLGGY